MYSYLVISLIIVMIENGHAWKTVYDIHHTHLILHNLHLIF